MENMAPREQSSRPALPPSNHPQGGMATLLVVLIIILVITMLSITGVRVSNMELRMAGNEAERMAAVDTAMAAVDATISDLDNFPVVGNPGYTLCSPSMASLDASISCDASTITLANPPFSTEAGVYITRQNPEALPPPRSLETSADKYDVASFEIDSRFTAASSRGGRSRMRQGFMILVPKSGQSE